MMNTLAGNLWLCLYLNEQQTILLLAIIETDLSLIWQANQKGMSIANYCSFLYDFFGFALRKSLPFQAHTDRTTEESV